MSLDPWPAPSWGAERHLMKGRLCPTAARMGSFSMGGARSPEAWRIAASLMCACLAQRWRQGATSPSESSGWAWLQQSIGLKMVSCAALRPTWGLYPKGREAWKPWEQESEVSPQLARDGWGGTYTEAHAESWKYEWAGPKHRQKNEKMNGWAPCCILRARGRNG